MDGSSRRGLLLLLYRWSRVLQNLPVTLCLVVTDFLVSLLGPSLPWRRRAPIAVEEAVGPGRRLDPPEMGPFVIVALLC